MAEEQQTALVPLDGYLAAGVHIGTKFRTKHMAPFIYKVNPTGLSILNVEKIDKRLELAGRLIARYPAEKVLVTGRRENSWLPIKAFCKATGCRDFAGRYPAGLITNSNLTDFYEPELVVVTDPWPDKNAVHDALVKGIPVIALCDSNNAFESVDFAVPCNNKGAKSLGLVFWILASQVLKERGIIPRDQELAIPVEKFTGEETAEVGKELE